MIVQYVFNLDSRGFPRRLCSVEEVANRLLVERNAAPVGQY